MLALERRLSQRGAHLVWLPDGSGWHFCIGASVAESVDRMDVAMLAARGQIVLHIEQLPTYRLKNDGQANT